MARARRFRSSFRGGQRRKKTWIQALTLSGPGGQLIPMIITPALTVPGVDSFARIVDTFQPASPDSNGLPTESTVLRIRGQVSVGKSQGGGGTDKQVGFGICVMDLPSIPADSDDLPGPLSAPEWDGWMFVRGPSEFSAVTVNDSIYDVKAMRKVEGGQRLAFVTEVYSEDGTDVSPTSTYTARVLLALP